jgi:AcrR family transcriptional regulator
MRQPVQDRAKATVAAILTATRDILVKDGFTRLTTNHIAAVAGVSVGSLYQYFPDKHAVLLALIRDHAANMRAKLQAAVISQLGKSPIQIVESTIATIVEAFATERPLIAALRSQIPSGDAMREIEILHEQQINGIAMLLRMFGRGKIDHPDRLAFVLFKAVDGILMGWLAAPPGRISEAAIKEELTRLAAFYLAPIMKAS